MLSGGERPSKAFGEDRVCRQPGCNTKLSMYNNGKYCFQHEPMAVPAPGARRSPDQAGRPAGVPSGRPGTTGGEGLSQVAE